MSTTTPQPVAPVRKPAAGPVAQLTGEVVYLYAFDVAYEMTRLPVRELLGQPVAHPLEGGSLGVRGVALLVHANHDDDGQSGEHPSEEEKRARSYHLNIVYRPSYQQASAWPATGPRGSPKSSLGSHVERPIPNPNMP